MSLKRFDCSSDLVQECVDTVVFLEQGLSVNPVNFNGTKFPIVYGHNVSRTCTELQAG